MQVGWLGLGAMGPYGGPGGPRGARGPRLRRRAGACCVPGRGRRAPRRHGGRRAGGADLTVIMVATPGQLEEELFAPGGAAGSLAPGSMVVVMATVGPEAVISAADRLAAGGVAAVDASVSGARRGPPPATC